MCNDLSALNLRVNVDSCRWKATAATGLLWECASCNLLTYVVEAEVASYIHV